MSELAQPLNVPVSDKDYRLAEDYTYEWEHRGFRYRIVVPAGFIYDGASVPRIAWTLTGLRPDGLIRAAALIHDWVYVYEGQLPPGSHLFQGEDGSWQEVHGRWSRRDADRLFGRVMREAGVATLKRRVAYLAARLFGWVYWP